MKITAATHNEFIVEISNSPDDQQPVTVRCFLAGNVLRTVPCKRGEISIIAPIRITLGPVSFAKVTALRVGQSVDLGASR